jgi:hypothetical protein
MVIDIANIQGMTAPAFNIHALVPENAGIRSVAFVHDGNKFIDNASPYALCGDKVGMYNLCGQLGLGIHTVKVTAYSCDNARCLSGPPLSVSFTIQHTKIATAAPKSVAPAVRTPIAAPLTVAPRPVPSKSPTRTPANIVSKSPTKAPIATPMVILTRPPTKVPLMAPTKSPTVTSTRHPTKFPTRAPTKFPTKRPTKRPTGIPTKGPTTTPTRAPVNCNQSIQNADAYLYCNTPPSCDASIETYINCITLSKRTLTLTGTTLEDKALQFLVYNDTLKLKPDSEANKTRLRQRFALMTFGLMPDTSGLQVAVDQRWYFAANECDWTQGGITQFNCQDGQVSNLDFDYFTVGTISPDLGWLTSLRRFTIQTSFVTGTLPSLIGWWTSLTHIYLSTTLLTGSIPSEIGQWTALDTFVAANSKLKGSIPTHVGKWTALAYFNVGNNMLSGTIPSSVLQWTAIKEAYFDNNKFNGTMPSFGGGFCPKLGNGTKLQADCKNTTGQTKIVCTCCNVCS